MQENQILGEPEAVREQRSAKLTLHVACGAHESDEGMIR